MVISYSKLPEGYRLASLSEVAAYEPSKLTFGLGLVIGAVLSYVFFRCYVDRAFKSDQIFAAFYTTAIISQIVVALVPIHSGRSTDIIHWTAALTLAFGLGAIMFRFATNQSDEIPAEIRSRAILWVFFLVYALNLYAVFFLESFFVTQTFVIIVFWYWMVRVTFLRPAGEHN